MPAPGPGLRVGASLAAAVLALHLAVLAPDARAPGPVARPMPRRVEVRVRTVSPVPKALPDTAIKAMPHLQPRATPAHADGPRTPASALADGRPSRPDATHPLPLYPTRLADAASLSYRLRRGGADGAAELQWRIDDGGGYRLALRTAIDGRPALGWTSEGVVDDHGLAPLRHAELQRNRERRAVNFQRPTSRITFSGPDREYALQPGVQDRLSWLLQLGAIVAADPALAAPGHEIALYVVGARGDAEVWTFHALGLQTIELGAGTAVQALLFRRDPSHPYDTRVEVWLDPARQQLPARVRWQAPPATTFTELVLESARSP